MFPSLVAVDQDRAEETQLQMNAAVAPANKFTLSGQHSALIQAWNFTANCQMSQI